MSDPKRPKPTDEPNANYREIQVKVADIDNEIDRQKAQGWTLETALDNAWFSEPTRTVSLVFRRNED